jgi:hypothetical protein
LPRLVQGRDIFYSNSMAKYFTIFICFIGLANIREPVGVPLILIGIYAGCYVIFGGSGALLSLAASIPIVGYITAGWVGVVVALLVLVGLCFGIARRRRKTVAEKKYILDPGSRIIAQRPVGQLSERLSGAFAYPNLKRFPGESPTDFAGREYAATMMRGVDDYEIEVVPGSIALENSVVRAAEFHRVVIYRRPHRRYKSGPKEVVELKIKTISGGARLRTHDSHATCADNDQYPVSMKKMHRYRIVDGSVRLGTVNFIRITDESGDPYFYPHTMLNVIPVESVA